MALGESKIIHLLVVTIIIIHYWELEYTVGRKSKVLTHTHIADCMKQYAGVECTMIKEIFSLDSDKLFKYVSCYAVYFHSWDNIPLSIYH